MGTECLVIKVNIGHFVAQLKDELEYTYQMADAAHGREQQAQEVILNLRRQISRISAEVDTQAKVEEDDEE